MKKKYVWIPTLLAIAVVLGIFIGKLTEQNSFHNKGFRGSNNKIDLLLNTIENQYVDTVDMNELVENAIPEIVKNLDPHSVYIPAKDLETTNEELEGSFSGIGVQFNIQNDTVMVISVISGGPSEKAGLMPGDRIVLINDSTFTGKTINNERVMKTLRGTKGSVVKISVKRNTSKQLLSYDITRGDIPVNSVDASYIIDKKIGFIKISKFGRTTYDEFVTALAKLNNQGAKQYIVDLRGNSGGFMDMAINMVNEFLPKGKLIVYTEGKALPRNDAFSNGMGAFQDSPLVVLIDEWSASASEIFSGAIQDNDRGTIIGRRSYGKGLVQQQLPFRDGSAIRLTIARYYTPSGRSIQKEYKLGGDDEYGLDLLKRYSHGEFYSKDSIHLNDSLIYYTSLGRKVYGGGGIMPDIFVPSDTSAITSYLNNVSNAGLTYQYAFQYADKNRDKLLKYKNYQELSNYLLTQPLLEEFVTFAETKGVRRRPVYIEISKKEINKQIESFIIRNIQGDESFYKHYLKDDNTLNKAIDILNSGKAFPQNSDE